MLVTETSEAMQGVFYVFTDCQLPLEKKIRIHLEVSKCTR